MWIYLEQNNCFFIKQIWSQNKTYYKIKFYNTDWIFSRKEFNKLRKQKIIIWKEGDIEKEN